MKASEFKTEIKKIKELLRGLTIQFVTEHSVKPINSLREFGLQVLEQERFGNDLRIERAWTNEGTIRVNSFDQLIELFRTKKITCVTVEAFYQPKDFADSIRHGFVYND